MCNDFPVMLRTLLLFLMMYLLSDAFAQSATVTGKVTDVNGQPIPSATIQVKGKQNTTVISNEDGTFSIAANPTDVLVFSSVGYYGTEIRVGQQTNLTISLTAAIGSLNEVVVTGYGTTSRKNLTTAISKIDPKNVPQAANSSVAQLVFGQAAGVQGMQQSAEPGGNINISIRGRGAPLIVIDGVVTPFSPLEPGNNNVANELNGVRRGGIAGLNPEDIESIEFLKDASAAIYGVNAANGVMLITTKKGKSGRMSITYDGSYSYVANQKYLEPLSASDYMSYYNQLTYDKYLLDNKQVPYGPNSPSGFVPKYTSSQIGAAGEGTDWLGEVLRNGSITNHNLGISGGTEKVTYFFSGNFFDQQGTMKNSSMRRYTGRMNLTYNLAKFISLNTNVNASKNYYANSTAGWQNGGSGTQGFGALQAALAYPRSMPVYDANGNYTLFQVTGNPVSLLDIKDRTDYNSLNATISLDLKLIGNELTGRLLYGNLTESSIRDFFVPSKTFYFQLFQSRGSWSEAKRQNQTMEATLAYKKRLMNDNLNLDALAGVGQYQYDETGFGASATDMLDAIGTDNLAAGSATSRVVNSNRYFTKTRSYFAKVGLDFFDRYVIQGTFRYDGFNNFFPDNKYAAFPSASIAWKISNEAFMKNLDFISLLKLRASIGITGQASGYAYAAYVPDVFLVSFNSGASQIIPYTIASIDHPELQWPKTINKNIGLDFSLFKDHVSGSFDWFRDDITRLIANATTAPLSFLGTQPVNGAHRVRTGWEFGLNTRNISTENFHWNSLINVSHVAYTHKERFPFETIPQGGNVDDPVNSIYAFQTAGILQIGENAEAWQPVNASNPGAPKFIDVNGDKILDSKDIVRYDASPTHTIGFGNYFSYKQLDLGIMFYSQFGAWGYNNLVSWATPAGFIAGNQSGIQEMKNVWSSTNTSGTLPGVGYDAAALGLAAGINTSLEKTDFIRCRNITLGYNFNTTRVFKSLKLYVDAQNPFIITNYKIADPEVEAGAVKGGAAPYPMATTYSFGVKAGF